MKDIAVFYKRVILDKEKPSVIKKDVKEFRKEYQTLHYCFKEDFKGYEFHTLVK